MNQASSAAADGGINGGTSAGTNGVSTTRASGRPSLQLPGLPNLPELLQGLTEDFERQRAEIREMRSQLETLSTTVSSDRHVVKVTVGPRGELTDLELASPEFERLSGKELARLIVETTQKARRKALERVRDLIAPTLPPGLSIDGLMEGRVDVAGLLPEQPFDPQAVAEFVKILRRRGGTEQAT